VSCKDVPGAWFGVPWGCMPGGVTVWVSRGETVTWFPLLAVGLVVRFLLASKEWLLQPGVPGAWPCIMIMVVVPCTQDFASCSAGLACERVLLRTIRRALN
jgi:hypothetical protein